MQNITQNTRRPREGWVLEIFQWNDQQSSEHIWLWTFQILNSTQALTFTLVPYKQKISWFLLTSRKSAEITTFCSERFTYLTVHRH